VAGAITGNPLAADRGRITPAERMRLPFDQHGPVRAEACPAANRFEQQSNGEQGVELECRD